MNNTNDVVPVVSGGRRVVDLDSGSWQVCEAAIRRFEAAWQAGPPSITEFLPAEEPLRSAVLFELVQIDQELRRKRGESVQAESYLRQFPELSELEFPTVGPDAETRRGSEPARPLAPTELPQLPGFEILQELGRGGMGVVYLARQTALKRLVAVKMLRGSSADAEERARFRTEIEAAARLKHPHIVQIYEVGEHDGQPYCVLEYVAGGSLQQALGGKPQPAEAAARMIEQLAQAVQHAHEQGVVHRDLKPANVLLEAREQGTGDREQNRLPCAMKVADFGLARQLEADAQHTQTGAIVGTPAYMSPEQAAGQSKACGPATDIYSLGVMLYELLTGRPPFQGASVLDTLEQVRSQEPVPPRALQPRTPRDLNTICLKCLRKEPAGRYATAAALAGDLAAFNAGRPISARPVGLAERTWKGARRKPLVATLTATVIAVAATGLVAGIYQYGQTRAALAATATALRNEQTALTQTTAALKRESSERAAKERALGESQQALADMDAFSRFVGNDVLAAARPEGLGGLGVSVTVREALDAASEKLPERFAGQPRAEAVARRDLGDTYATLGEPAKAEMQYREALRLTRQILGDDHEATMRNEVLVGEMLRKQDQLPEAIAIHERLRPRCERLFGENASLTIVVLYDLVSDYLAAKRFKDALALSSESVRRNIAAFGEDHRSTMLAQLQRAEILRITGKHEQALPIALEVYRWRMERQGAEHPTTLNAANTVALLYQKLDRTPEAQQLLEENLEATRRKYGPEHLTTLAAAGNVAQIYVELGRAADALPLLEPAQRLTLAKLGLGHAHVQGLTRQLARTYKAAQRPADAVPLLTAIYEERVQSPGPQHRDTREIYLELYDVLIATQPDAAVTLAERHLAAVQGKVGDKDRQTLLAINKLAIAYMDTKQAKKAIPRYEQAAQISAELYGPDDADTLQVRRNLSAAYLADDRPDDAVCTLEEALQQTEQKLGADHPTTIEAVFNLGLRYHQVRRYKDAAAAFRRVLTTRTRLLGRDHVETLQAMYRLCAAQMNRGELAEAEQLLSECQRRLGAMAQPPAQLVKLVELAQRSLALRKARASGNDDKQGPP